jgi:CheY-like chemotaxis protein
MNAVRHDGSHAPTKQRTLQILMVDDCLDNRETMALWLGGMGHEVQAAADGREALGMAGRNPPDIVLLDLGLPGMSGYELAGRLRAMAIEKQPLIVAVTGSLAPGDLVRSTLAGIDEHLVKPVKFEAICTVFSRFHTTGL